MRERPIIFSSELVRAILDGRKSQTRRIAKIQGYPNQDYSSWSKEAIDAVIRSRCPYGVVGDKLWVRESFVITTGGTMRNYVHGRYLFDKTEFCANLSDREYKLFRERKKPLAKTSGRFMYKSLARIWLEIKNIRVERVRDISIDDCNAEGMSKTKHIDEWNARNHFANLWDSLNAKRGYGWDKNPWVWVIEFEVKK